MSSLTVLEPSLGLDISKAKLDACLLLGTKAHHTQYDNTPAGLQRLRTWCHKLGAPTAQVVLEATGRYSDLAANLLHQAGHHVHVANPRRIKDYARSLGRRNKTDRIDAELIASFGRGRSLVAWQPPANEQLLLRQWLRRLHELETLRQAERNRQQTISEPQIQRSLQRVLRALDKECSAVEAHINHLIASTPTLRADVERLCQIEGIGLRSARWLCAELPRHLPNARAAAAWLAVTPRLRHSGSSLRSTAPVGHDGNRHLRRTLYMAAVVARRHNPRLKTFADRLANNGKSKMTVLFAVLHKLFKISFSILKHHTPYDPNHIPILTTKN